MLWSFSEQCLELIKFYLIFYYGFHFKVKRKCYVYLLDLLAVTVVSCMMTWGHQSMNPIMPYLFFVIFTSLITYMGRWYEKAGIAVWTAFTIGLIDGISCTVIQVIFGYFGMNYAKLESLGASVMTVVFLFVCMNILNHRNSQGLGGVPVRYFVLFSVMVFIDQISLSLIWERFVMEEFSLYAVFLFLSLGVLVQMVLVLLLASDNYLYRERQILNQKYLAAQEQHYRYLEHKEEDTKKFRHDMRDHMYTVSRMAKLGRNHEIVRYMERIFQILDGDRECITVGNGVVDAIFNQYIERFGRKHILFHVTGHLPSDCFVEPFDLCTIFFNILQNAEEAAEQCEVGNRSVTMHIRYQKQMILIQELPV